MTEACRTCGADVDTWCVTTRGRAPGRRWATFLHADRLWTVQRAHSLGYTEGQRDAFEAVEREVRYRARSTSATWPPIVSLDQLLERTRELAAVWREYAVNARNRIP